MLGNVTEWVWDGFAAYTSSSQIDPTGVDGASTRGGKGGSWYNNANNVRAAVRLARPPAEVHDDQGFRVVRTLY